MVVGEVVLVVVGRSVEELAELGAESKVLSVDEGFGSYGVVEGTTQLGGEPLATAFGGTGLHGSSSYPGEGFEAVEGSHVGDVAEGVLGVLGLGSEDVPGVGVVVGVAREAVIDFEAEERGVDVAKLDEGAKGVGRDEADGLAQIVGSGGVVGEDSRSGDAEVNLGQETVQGSGRGFRLSGSGSCCKREERRGDQCDASESPRRSSGCNDQEQTPLGETSHCVSLLRRVGGGGLQVRCGFANDALVAARAQGDAGEWECDEDEEGSGSEGDRWAEGANGRQRKAVDAQHDGKGSRAAEEDGARAVALRIDEEDTGEDYWDCDVGISQVDHGRAWPRD